MKFKKSTLGLLLFSGALLTSCSSDNLVNGEPEVVDKDTRFYINVEIANPGGNSTRADNANNEDNGNYTDGDEKESAIHNILFIFYNAEYQYVGNSTVNVNSNNTTSQTNPGTIESVVEVTVPVDVNTGSTKPAYVLAFVNPVMAEDDRIIPFKEVLGLNRKLDAMIPHKDAAIDQTKKQGYTMTNSVYYDEENGDQPIIAAPIKEGQLYVTEDDAKKSRSIQNYYICGKSGGKSKS